MSGDIYVWQSEQLSRVVSKAHSGPVMVMYTCLEDGLILSAGKERYICMNTSMHVRSVTNIHVANTEGVLLE